MAGKSGRAPVNLFLLQVDSGGNCQLGLPLQFCRASHGVVNDFSAGSGDASCRACGV